MNNLIKHSLFSSDFYNFNLNNDTIIFDLIKNELYNQNDLIQLGAGPTNNIYINVIMIIGIILIIVGIILYFYKDDWKATIGTINSIKKVNNSKKYNLDIIYVVNNIKYSKIITQDKTYNSETITIYYKESNPNEISLYENNYITIGIILAIIGILMFIFSIYTNLNNNNNNNDKNKNGESLYSSEIKTDDSSDIYLIHRNAGEGIDIVYTIDDQTQTRRI